MYALARKLDPSERFRAALAVRDLQAAERAAREVSEPDLGDMLELILLMRSQNDGRYERAACRWLGHVLVRRPGLGLKFTAEAARALKDVTCAVPDVGRAQLAMLLRTVDLVESAVVAETWA